MTILLGFLSVSCGQQTNNSIDAGKIKEQVNHETGVVLPDYISLNVEINQAMGDYVESIEIKFDSLNFDILVKRVENKIENNNLTKRELINGQEFYNRKWEYYESGYKIENFFPGSNKRINYYINFKKRTLFYLYVEE